MCVVALMLSGCLKMTSSTGIETALAVCAEWADALFLPSRSDTEETAIGLTELRLKQQAACGGLL